MDRSGKDWEEKGTPYACCLLLNSQGMASSCSILENMQRSLCK